jgi:hypothetical protein
VNLSTTIDRVRAADTALLAALTASHRAPPDQNFSKRLRALGTAAALEAGALEYAVLSEVAKKPALADVPPLPYELTPQASRPGPPQLWDRFDEAAEAWAKAMRGTSVAPLATAFRGMAAVLDKLADEVDMERGVETHDADRQAASSS